MYLTMLDHQISGSGDLMIKHGNIHENKCCWDGRFLSGDRVARCENKPSNPNDCFAPRQKKEIKHGEIMGKNCCWQGVLLPKAKCETQVSHPDNCYAAKLGKEIKHGEQTPTFCCWYGQWLRNDNCYHPRSKKEIMHGEIGPLGKACCWYGKWANKSNCDSGLVGHKDDFCLSHYICLFSRALLHFNKTRLDL